MHRCVYEINSELDISRAVMIIERGKMTSDDSGVTFTKESRRTMKTESETGRMKYDLVGRIAGKTEIPRKVITAILKGIDRSKFAMYRVNPEIFITETARIIRGVKVSVSFENISYRTLDDFNSVTLAEKLDILRSESMTAETPA